MELIWTFAYQEMPTKLVVRTDATWTGQNSEDQKCFSCVVVRFGEHVIAVVCAKQDVVALSTPESEFCAVSTGRAHGTHTKRHLHKKELWLQDQVAAKNVELGRVPSEDNEAHLGTKYRERDCIKKCVTKMGMLFAGAWAGEQLLVVISGTGTVLAAHCHHE